MRSYTFPSAVCTFLLLIAAALTASCGGSPFRVEEFKPVIRAHPTPADEWFNLGFACTILEREDDAVKAFEEALREAADAYREAIRIRPDFIYARFNLGVVCFSLGDTASATEQWKALKELNPDLAKTLYEYLRSQGRKPR